MELDPKYDHYDYPTTAPVEAPGHPGHLKPAEVAQVHQLRMLLETEGFTKRLDTLTLVSFLSTPPLDPRPFSGRPHVASLPLPLGKRVRCGERRAFLALARPSISNC